MPDPVAPRLPALVVQREGAYPTRPPSPVPATSFADALAVPAVPAAAPTGLAAAVRGVARELADRQEVVERGLRRARRGEGLSPQELLALQAGVYRYTQELELVSKVVDKATQAVRSTLQSQQ